MDTGFIRGLFHVKDMELALKRYMEFVRKQLDTATDQGIHKCLARFAVNEYRRGRRIIYRDFKAQSLMDRIGHKLGIELPGIEILRSGKSVASFKALTVFAMRTLCGMSYKDICKAVGNVSLSGCSRLYTKGYELIAREKIYRSIYAEVSGMTLHV